MHLKENGTVQWFQIRQAAQLQKYFINCDLEKGTKNVQTVTQKVVLSNSDF